MPRAAPSARFVQNLGQDIRRAARDKMGSGTSLPFDEMVIELRKLIRLLRKTLVPVQLRSSFVSTLGTRLQADAEEQFVTRQQRMRWLMVGGVVGSVISLLGVVTALLLWRRNGRLHAKKPLGAA
jgi:hypothetical protein